MQCDYAVNVEIGEDNVSPDWCRCRIGSKLSTAEWSLWMRGEWGGKWGKTVTATMPGDQYTARLLLLFFSLLQNGNGRKMTEFHGSKTMSFPSLLKQCNLIWRKGYVICLTFCTIRLLSYKKQTDTNLGHLVAVIRFYLKKSWFWKVTT